MTPDRPVVAITMGDVAGVGPEIIAKSLARPDVFEWCRPLVIGDAGVLARDLRFAGAPLEIHRVDRADEATFVHGTIDILQPGAAVSGVTPGQLSPIAGRAAVEYVTAAVDLAKAGHVVAIVTAPLNKEAMHLGGYAYPGHTELLAELFGITDFSLVLNAGRLFVFHVTTHLSLRDAIEQVTESRVVATIELAHRFAEALGRSDEAVAVAGLNPHAGEHGLFGREDEEIVRPAVELARSHGIDVIGPLPADALFPAAMRGERELVVAMYHDQGHAPFKSVHSDRGVNITVGLPVIRTSVDHGTAFDIAGRGVARPDSLLAAIKVAVDLAPRWSTFGRGATSPGARRRL